MIRLILLLLLLSLSLLVVFKAPTYHLWLAAIVVTEFPFIFLTTSVLLVISGFWLRRYQWAGTVTGLLAILLFISPVVRAWLLAREMKKEFSQVFGATAQEPYSFSLLDMLPRMDANKNKRPPHAFIYQHENNLALDFYQSELPGLRPCVVVIHGGSWKSGDNTQLPELNYLLADLGYNVAAINYRLAPQFKSSAPVQDVSNAFNFLIRYSQALRIDTNNFVLLGRSAGAQIALLAAYTLKVKGLRGVIDFYGPADMVWGYSVPSNPLVMDSRKVMEDYLGGTYHNIPQKYTDSSPLNFVSALSPPTLIIHGKNDVLVACEHSRRLHNKLTHYGVKNYFLSLPWATHGFDYTLHGPGGQLSTFAVKAFLDQVTK